MTPNINLIQGKLGMIKKQISNTMIEGRFI